MTVFNEKAEMGTDQTEVITLFNCRFVNLALMKGKKQVRYPQAEGSKV